MYEPVFPPAVAPEATAKLYSGKMSAAEFVCYFPNHTAWPDVILRLAGNGWEDKLIAAAQLYFHGEANEKNFKKVYDNLRQ